MHKEKKETKNIRTTRKKEKNGINKRKKKLFP